MSVARSAMDAVKECWIDAPGSHRECSPVDPLEGASIEFFTRLRSWRAGVNTTGSKVELVASVCVYVWG